MDTRNMILAIAMSVVIIFGVQVIAQNFGTPRPLPAHQQQQAQQAPLPDGVPRVEVPAGAGQQGAAAVVGGVPAQADREEVIAAGARVAIDSPTLRGSISLTGGRLDDLVLTQYREQIDPESDQIALLSPAGTPQPYFVNFSWLGAAGDLAPADSVWQADGDTLVPGTPVTLTWTNEAGVRFEKVFELDENYLFTVTQRVFNDSGEALSLSPYGAISRTGTPDVLGFYILHEGLIGVLDGVLEEVDYDDVADDGLATQDGYKMAYQTTGGWIGITDKYWLVTMIPDQARPVSASFFHSIKTGVDKYQADYFYGTTEVPAGGSFEVTNRLFAGAKVVETIDHYQDTYGFPLFDRAVDFGWFYYLTKPLFYALHYIAELTGNYGIAILVLTVFIKLLFFPLANKSYKAMAKMRKVQPQMLELREKYGDDKQKLNQEMMALYKKEGANPVSGCLPVLIQIPVFFALYKVLFVTIEMRQAPFFGWIQDLSVRDPTSILNGFGLLPWEVPFLGPFDLLNLGIWPILMGLTMYLQQKLNPQPADPVQAKVFLFMPFIFTFLLAAFPAGLVIYWTWNNLLSILQQYVIMRQAGVPIGSQPAKT